MTQKKAHESYVFGKQMKIQLPNVVEGENLSVFAELFCRAGGLERAIDARRLHKTLGSKRQFANWFKERVESYGFVENEDYEVINKIVNNPHGGRPQIDYALSMDMAKELCMIEHSDVGKRIRKYFIKCEKEYHKVKQQPPRPNFMLRYDMNRNAIPHKYFSVMNEVYEVYMEFERQGHILPDIGVGGKTLTPDISVGRTFAMYLKRNEFDLNGCRKYQHKFPDGRVVNATMYPNRLYATFKDFLFDIWFPQYASNYFAQRDPLALEYLPKLLEAI